VDDDFGWLDATAQRRLLASGEVSARELVASAIARIERLNPALNAVIHTQFEEALEHPGVPLLLKDVLATEAGQPYHCGLRAAKSSGHRATADSWLVTRYKNAGFVVLGRTNTPELAGSVTTEPLAYGPTRNPWALERSPGGSSGGSAAAVASGMVAVAHGNDMGGSIRIPASNCGLVGLKPSRARTSLGPEFGEYWGPLTHQHVLTRTVRDSAAMLDVSAGPAPGDPYSAPPPARPWVNEVATDPGRLRVGYRTALPDGSAPSTEVAAAVSGTAHLLEELGHDVLDAVLPALDDPAVRAAAGTIFAVAIARDVARWSAVLGRDITAELEADHVAVTRMGREIPATRWVADIETIQSWCRVMARTWNDVDVLLLPVMPDPPRPMGEPSPAEAGRLIAFTLPFNLTGEPAISLPLHQSVDGLPVGVQLVAPTGREDLLFRVAGQLEIARPWAHLRPAMVST
jgi:amidase